MNKKENIITYIILVLSLIGIILLFFVPLDIISFKTAITRTKSIKISKLYQENDSIENIITDSNQIKAFIKILSDISYTSEPVMSSISDYQIILLDKRKKQIAEIYCIPNIIVKDLNHNIYLENDKNEELLELIKLIDNENTN